LNAIVYVAQAHPDAKETSDYLERLGYKIRPAHPGSQVAFQVAGVKPDLVIFDMAEADARFPTLISEIKEQSDVPILLLRRPSSPFPLVAVCLTAGADDVLSSRSDVLEVQSRLTLLGRVGRDRKRISERLVGLEAEVDHQRKMSTVDPLTELYNRRYLTGRLTQELKRAQRYGNDLSVVLFDVDHFKKVNDSHGHDVGDEALKHVAEVLRIVTRDTDVVARYGGEEFCVVLPNSGLNNGLILANRAVRRLEEMPLILPGIKLSMTMSGGIAEFTPENADSASKILKRADLALYDAKESGRNRVCGDGRMATPLGTLHLAAG
jgi:diguanylate cyclase (GGDEF)-like protein